MQLLSVMANSTGMCLSSPTCMYGEQGKGMVFYSVSTNNPSVSFGGAAPAKLHPQLVVRVPWSSAWKGDGRTRTSSGATRSPLNGALHSVDLFATFAKSIRHLKSYCISARTPERCIGVVAKIESSDSLTDVREMFQVPDGAVVARGDLGVPSEEVSSLQQQEDSGRSPAAAPLCSRRLALCLVFISAFVTAEGPAQARARKKKSIPIEDYQTSGDGLKFYDITEGKGPTADTGSTAVVHFDCVYRSLTVVSSRESKLLGGNRIIAEPYEFVVGSVPGKERKEAFVEYANGLYSAQAAPKPPPALYSVTAGMRVGGQRTVIVPPELGYGTKGFAEIPSGATIELNIELLEVKKTT